MRPTRLFWLAFILFSTAGPASALPVRELTIVTKTGERQFKVELAVDDASRERGLMFRQELASDHGMLFDFQTEQRVSFWMRNTLIPLDMLFIDRTGRIVTIHAMAVPGSEDAIASGRPVRAVLEIAGGEAEKQHIEVGDRVRDRIFSDANQ